LTGEARLKWNALASFGFLLALGACRLRPLLLKSL
jgi:hypothetical protein